MSNIRKLTMGVDVSPPSAGEEKDRIAELRATVEHYVPEFAEAVRSFENQEDSILMLHQDAFAAGYDDDEYTLMGMAMKYAGLHGVAITIICGPSEY